MKIECLQFRWINASCYEFKLPDGRVLTIDPYLDRADQSFRVENMLTPNYIFCTHTHFDHIMELGDLMRRSDDTKLFVSEITAPALVDYYDLKFGQVYGISHGHRITVDGIDILPCHGKHSRFAAREKELKSKLQDLMKHDTGISGMEQLMLLGSTVYTDFMLTLPHNLKIFMTGGDKTFSTPYEIAKKYAPFVVIRQVSNLKSPEEYADIVAQLGGQIVLPHHQEHAERRLGMPMAEFSERVSTRLAEVAPGMMFVNPEQYKWYEFGVSVGEI